MCSTIMRNNFRRYCIAISLLALVELERSATMNASRKNKLSIAFHSNKFGARG